MPKFIGKKIAGATRSGIENATEKNFPGHVRLSFSQAKLLPAECVVCSLDTTDKGSKGSYAKRWYRWFAPAEAIANSPAATAKMRDAAKRHAQATES